MNQEVALSESGSNCYHPWLYTSCEKQDDGCKKGKKGSLLHGNQNIRNAKFVVGVIRAAVSPGRDEAPGEDLTGSVPPEAISRSLGTRITWEVCLKCRLLGPP